MARPKDRASAEGLLPNMEARPWADGVTVTYRYHPKGGRPVNLGTDRRAALQAVLDMTGQAKDEGTLRWVWNKYTSGSKRWAKLTEGSRRDYEGAWKQIELVFGGVQASAITSPMVARYVHVERAGSPRRADIEKALMSNLFKHAILLGAATINPTIGVEPHGSEASDVMPEEAALRAFLAWLDTQTPQRRILACAAEYAALAGNRQVEFLHLSWPQVDRDAEGVPVLGGKVRVKRAKQRGKKRGEIIEAIDITPRLHALLLKIKSLDRDGLYLFPNEDGNAYTSKGFRTIWQRCVVAAIQARVMTAEQRFNFHALRRYYATNYVAANNDLPNLHANRDVTARVYDATKVVNRRAL